MNSCSLRRSSLPRVELLSRSPEGVELGGSAVGLEQLGVGRGRQEATHGYLGIDLVVGADVPLGGALEEVHRRHLVGVVEANGANDLQGSVHSLGLVAPHAHRLGVHVEAFHECLVLRCDAGGAGVGVALERLDAAQRQHHSARRIAHVRSHGQGMYYREPRRDLPAGNDCDLVAQLCPTEHVVHNRQALVQGHANAVAVLGRRSACATLSAINRDEVGSYASVTHGMNEACELVRPSHAQLQTNGLAMRCLT
mmetsp:Transcript_17827/g.69117  ORF Transcript_17827/g.69117 Transcript_17827/m.69117 type:complete len:253 (+) Transcript_17827:1731-2489(+)